MQWLADDFGTNAGAYRSGWFLAGARTGIAHHVTVPYFGRCLGSEKAPLENSESDDHGRRTGICVTCSGRFELHDGLLVAHETALADEREGLPDLPEARPDKTADRVRGLPDGGDGSQVEPPVGGPARGSESEPRSAFVALGWHAAGAATGRNGVVPSGSDGTRTRDLRRDSSVGGRSWSVGRSQCEKPMPFAR